MKKLKTSVFQNGIFNKKNPWRKKTERRCASSAYRRCAPKNPPLVKVECTIGLYPLAIKTIKAIKRLYKYVLYTLKMIYQ